MKVVYGRICGEVYTTVYAIDVTGELVEMGESRFSFFEWERIKRSLEEQNIQVELESVL